jgi:hypothetical protein
MARAAPPKVDTEAGAYAHVRAGLEGRLELQERLFHDAPFQLQQQVDDVCAGRPVKVGARWLPPGAGVGAEVVIVHPDDRIEGTDENWAAQWLQEEGL